MKRVVNNKIYDTRKAHMILSDAFNKWLYKTESGKYFSVEGCRFTALTERQARDWVGANFDVEEYIRLFPDQILHEA